MTGDDVWERQILHFLASDEARVSALEAAYELISDDLLLDTIIVITRTAGAADPLY